MTPRLFLPLPLQTGTWSLLALAVVAQNPDCVQYPRIWKIDIIVIINSST